MHRPLPALLAFGALALAAPARAEEGMWTFDRFPAEAMRAANGWAPDEAWLARAMAGSARLENGCSGANVSAAGLVLTNHHCVIACLRELSGARDVLAEGFFARAREAEARCTGLAVQVLTGLSDVTARVAAAVNLADAQSFARARDAAIGEIERACEGAEANKRCEVATLYQGGRYGLYEYRRYQDVRLVFAPEAAAAYFGGAADNFDFPRFCFDAAIVRLYEAGAPAPTPRFLPMRFSPIAEGEVALVSGDPGATSRLMTSAQLAFQRDHVLPWRIAELSRLRARLAAFSARGAPEALAASDTLLNVENSLKALEGRRAALADAAGFARVTAREADLMARVRRNRAALREAGDAWGEIARAQEAYRAFYFPHQYLEARAGGGSELFALARDIVRAPAGGRIDLDHLSAERQIGAGLEAVLLGAWLEGLRARLGADEARAVLGGEAPEALARRLVAGTRLFDAAQRRALAHGGAEAVSASKDALIVFVRSWDERARALDARYRDEVEAPVARAQERIAQARFRAFGESLYPDATFSPRLSFGRVEGWSEGARTIGAFTHLGALFERAQAAPGALAPRWREARARLDLGAQLNLASSHDLTNGNSGSPMLDREGRVIAVVFDGNLHSLGGEYFYDGARNRAVSLAAPAIGAALAHVYAMPALVAELEGR